MLVWLASYPRSGNTLLRIILRQALGAGTYSAYDDRFDIGADPEFAEVVGHVEHGRSEAEFIAWARAQPELIFAKTHEPDPRQLTDPAIYVVRDGRAASYSYWRYNREIAGSETSLRDVIHGNVFAGDWGTHVARWLAGSRRGPTLFMRFEELTADPQREWNRLAEFLNLDRSAPNVQVDFTQLNQRFPHFFRSGSNTQNIDAIPAEDLAEFMRLHGPTLGALGYGAATGQTGPVDVPRLRKIGADQLRQDALLELTAAAAIAKYQSEIAERLAQTRIELTASLYTAMANARPSAEDRISAEVARQALADLAPFEADVQARLQISSQRLNAASEAFSRVEQAGRSS